MFENPTGPSTVIVVNARPADASLKSAQIFDDNAENVSLPAEQLAEGMRQALPHAVVLVTNSPRRGPGLIVYVASNSNGLYTETPETSPDNVR